MTILEENIIRNTNAWKAVRDAIVAKGQEIPTGTPVEDFPQKILAIEGSEESLLQVAFHIDEHGHLIMTSPMADVINLQINQETGHLEQVID